MNCNQFETRFHSLLDQRGNPSADPALIEHAAQCGDCQRLLSGHATLALGLSLLPKRGIRRERVLAIVALARDQRFALRAAPSTGLSAGRRQLFTRVLMGAAGFGLAAAAALLLMIGLNALGRQKNRTDGFAASPPQRMWRGGQVRSKGFAIYQPGSGNGAVVASKTDFTTADLLLAAPRLPNRLRNYHDAVDQLVVVLPEAARRLEEAERLSPGLRPLYASLEFFWDALFGPDASNQDKSSQPHQQRSTRRTRSFSFLV
jgi:hypothetical protein